jgi:hypothetical protein
METTEPPKRRWFQFHLSTLIILTLVAGALLYLNLANPYGRGKIAERPVDIWYGWPYGACGYECRYPDSRYIPPSSCMINNSALLTDVLCAVLILALIGVLCEAIISRRKHQAKGE